MHSRIFQVSMEPIREEEYISEADYYEHWFTKAIADYVVNSYNREEDIKWLSQNANGLFIEEDEDGKYFVVTNKKKYFENKYKCFIRELHNIGEPTLEDFVEGVNLWGLKNAHEDECGFYIEEDGELMTLDNFIRNCIINKKYYIGNTLDYHC